MTSMNCQYGLEFGYYLACVHLTAQCIRYWDHERIKHHSNVRYLFRCPSLDSPPAIWMTILPCAGLEEWSVALQPATRSI